MNSGVVNKTEVRDRGLNYFKQNMQYNTFSSCEPVGFE
jgi:hypothetical protein